MFFRNSLVFSMIQWMLEIWSLVPLPFLKPAWTSLVISKLQIKTTIKHHYKPVELFQILKDDAVKVLHSICQRIWKTQQWPQDWKRSVFFPIPKKGNAKECSNDCTIVLISHTSKVMLKFSRLGFSSMWTMNLQIYKLYFKETEEPEIKLPTFIASWRKQGCSRK